MPFDNAVPRQLGVLERNELTIPSTTVLPVGFCLQEQPSVVYGKLNEK